MNTITPPKTLHWKISYCIGYTVGIVKYWPIELWGIVCFACRWFRIWLTWTWRDAFTRARKKARTIKALKAVPNPERN